jgi:hypothetical protein
MATLVNERDDAFLDLEFTDKEGYPVTPVTGIYSIEDVGTGRVIRRDTIFTPISSTYSLGISSAENDILEVDNASEERRVTLTILFLDDEDVMRRKNVEFFYTVNNLKMLTTPVLEIENGAHILTTGTIVLTLP